MRNLVELNINEGGKIVSRPYPSAAVIDEFQRHFGVVLPTDYLAFLHYSNGGHPELDSFVPIGEPEGAFWSINRFYYLDDRIREQGNLWRAAEEWQPVLGKQVVPIAHDGGGNQIFLDLKTDPPPVMVCTHNGGFRLTAVATSFVNFLELLTRNPDSI